MMRSNPGNEIKLASKLHNFETIVSPDCLFDFA